MCVYVCVCDHCVLCVCACRKQELSNLLHEKKYLKALGLAISLDQPHTVLTVIKGTLSCSRRLLVIRIDLAWTELPATGLSFMLNFTNCRLVIAYCVRRRLQR